MRRKRQTARVGSFGVHRTILRGRKRERRRETTGRSDELSLKKNREVAGAASTSLHMATPREDQYPRQSYFSLDYGTLSLLLGTAI